MIRYVIAISKAIEIVIGHQEAIEIVFDDQVYDRDLANVGRTTRSATRKGLVSDKYIRCVPRKYKVATV